MSGELFIPKNYFSSHVRILRILGLWFWDNSDTRGSVKGSLYFLYQITFLFAFAYLFTLLEIIQLYFSWNNFDMFIHNLCYAIVHIMACTKITLLLIKTKEIETVMKTFESGIFRIRGIRTPDEIKIIKECILWTEKLLNIYFLIGTSVVVNGLLCPLYLSSHSNAVYENSSKNFTSVIPKKVANEKFEYREDRRLPYMSYFPFDVNVTPYHEIAYAYQSICLMILSPIIVTTDVLYGSILLHIAAQLRVLAKTLLCLRSMAVKNLRRYKSFVNCSKIMETKLLNEEIYRSLKQCVIHHYAIISLTMEMERIFSVLVLLQFLSNLVIMCFPLFQITSVPIMSFSFFSMASLMAAMMFQLFIFCDCGNEVTQQSLSVADAAYFSDWYSSFSSKINQAILLTINRSRRPLKLTVAKFAMLSRETYMNVVRASASYFMFLRKIHDDP